MGDKKDAASFSGVLNEQSMRKYGVIESDSLLFIGKASTNL